MKERARTAGRPGACLDGLPTRTCRGFLCVAAGWAIPPMRWSKQMRSGPKEPQVCVTVRSASQIITSSGRSGPEPTVGQLRDQQAFRFPRNESGRDTPDPTARPAGAYRSQLTATVTATAATNTSRPWPGSATRSPSSRPATAPRRPPPPASNPPPEPLRPSPACHQEPAPPALPRASPVSQVSSQAVYRFRGQ